MSEDSWNLTMEESAASLRAGAGSRAMPDAWTGCWRRSSRRWNQLAPRLASATGWRIWNPGRYGEAWHSLFRATYPLDRHPILVLGLNPGLYGMAQTGIPFTDVKRLREKLPLLAGRIRRRFGDPEVPGLAPPGLRYFLRRSFESSAVRVYRFLEMGWGSAEEAWKHVAVANACPLLFVDPVSGENRTPADLRRTASRGRRGDVRARELCAECDRLRRLSAREAEQVLQPVGVVLLGKDVQRTLREDIAARLGGGAVLEWEHPARAVPESWARGLLREIRRRGWK